MELVKRSNFKFDLTGITTTPTTPVVIKKGLKAIDFVGAIAESNSPQVGKQFTLIPGAQDTIDGTVKFFFGSSKLLYDPATGQITRTN